MRKGDTVAISSLLGTRLGVADTASMLSGYIKRFQPQSIVSAGTGGNTSSNAGKLNIADTAAMLYNYLCVKTDTSAMLLPYLQKRDTISLSDRINSKISFSDTSALLSSYLRKADRHH